MLTYRVLPGSVSFYLNNPVVYDCHLIKPSVQAWQFWLYSYLFSMVEQPPELCYNTGNPLFLKKALEDIVLLRAYALLTALILLLSHFTSWLLSCLYHWLSHLHFLASDCKVVFYSHKSKMHTGSMCFCQSLASAKWLKCKCSDCCTRTFLMNISASGNLSIGIPCWLVSGLS